MDISEFAHVKLGYGPSTQAILPYFPIWTELVPLYEYRCGDCQQVTSVLVRITSDSNQPACDHCESVNMVKIFSKFSFRGSWGDSLNWAPSQETMSDVNESNSVSVDNYMGRIKKEMGGQTTSDFNRERKDIKNSQP
ncbi:MAG: zinc ribbon domain-containing protein [Dehalococcoidia bacterium]|nr:zinc ribbon domain-containing protein [Dehalococcoidia bacterium]